MVKVIKEDEFESEVINKKGIVIVDFFADWCYPCDEQKEIFERIFEKEDKYTVIEIDTDENEALSEEYKIDAIPTLIFFKDGKVVKREEGVLEEEEIDEIIEEIKGSN